MLTGLEIAEMLAELIVEEFWQHCPKQERFDHRVFDCLRHYELNSHSNALESFSTTQTDVYVEAAVIDAAASSAAHSVNRPGQLLWSVLWSVLWSGDSWSAELARGLWPRTMLMEPNSVWR